MKRFSKILVAVAALCLLVGVLALAISANYTGATGKFVVNGQGYDTWEGEDGALAAANNTHTIYLNEDWTLDTGLTLSGATTNVKINLNGKTVTVKDGTPWFTVTTSAKLTVEGEGTLNNSGQMFIVARNTGTNVTVNATGKGITINNSSTIANVYTFFFTTGSTLNVSGKMVVNTTAVQASGGSRTIFYVYDKNKNSVKLNINDAYILYATPTVTGAPQGKVIYSGYSNISINNSKLEGIYSNIIYSVTKDSTTDGDGTVEIGATTVNTAEHITATNSVFISTKGKNYYANVEGSLMYLTGATKGGFTNCEFYGFSQAITATLKGNPATYAHTSQLTFNNCHFREAGYTMNNLFTYGPNFKLIGGSVAITGSVFAVGHASYKELDNGEWFGGYVDNVLSEKNDLVKEPVQTPGNWNNTTIYNPNSSIKGTLDTPVTLTVGGEAKTFTKGYFSDESIYESYKSGPSAEPSGVIVVDGVGYANELEAIEAIKEGSTVKLLANVTSYINKSGVSYKLEPNGFTFPGIISSTHKLVDYSGVGFYKLVEADASEIYTVNYSFNNETKTQTVAMGTVIPEMTEAFPDIVEDLKKITVTGWTLPVSVPNGYECTGLVINATPVTSTSEFVIMAGGVGYETLAAAVAGANGATITIYKDITVGAVINLNGIEASINLNGKTITAENNIWTVFYVTNGGSLTVTGTGAFDKVGTVAAANGANSVVNFYADGATDGIVINHKWADANGGDSDSTLSAFSMLSKTTLNVSGLVTVNAYNGRRIVFNVHSGAEALNISKAKIVVPLLERTPTTTAPKGYSWIIYMGDGNNVTITETEIEARYGQIFHVVGAENSGTKDVSAHKNTDYTWKDTAAQGVSIDAPTMTIVAKNSRFFSNFDTFGNRKYPTFMEVDGKLDAKFDNCTIAADYRGVSAIENAADITTTNINNHQLLFTDCDFVSSTGANIGAPFFMWGCNYKILGGTWSLGYHLTSYGSHYYLPLQDSEGELTAQWVGGYMDGILFDKAMTNLKHTGVTNKYSDSTYAPAARSCKITRVIDGAARTFTAAYFSNANDYLAEAKAYEALGAYFNTGVESTPFANVTWVAGNGTIDKTLGYVKHSFTGEAAASEYHTVDGNDNASWNYENLGTYVWEFDVSTDDGCFAKSNVTVSGRANLPRFGENGAFLDYELDYINMQSFDFIEDYIKFNGKTKKISTAKGDWTRITVVVNVVLGEEKTISVPAYADNGGTLEEVADKTVPIQVVDLTQSTLSIYVDGVLLDSINFVRTDVHYFNGAIPKDYIDQGYIEGLIIKNSAEKASSICYDNIVFMPITRADGEALGSLIGQDGKPASSIVDNPLFLSAPDNNAAPFNPVISVDEVAFESVKEANAAIKEGSIVELLANVDEAIEINYKDVKFVDNGYNFKGFVSSAYKFVDYSAARNADYSFPADASEIVTVTYPEYEGVSGTQTAVIGTLLKAPAEFDAVAKLLNEETKQYKVLAGWTLTEGEDVQRVTGDATAYPVFDQVGAAVVYWTNEDGTQILDTDFYFPGDATVLRDFDGTDLAVNHDYDYYGYGRTGWTGIDEATAGLAASGEYYVKAVMGKVAPDTFPGLKYNLSLYSNYVMNFYVPMEIEGVTNLTVSTTPDGSMGISKFDSGTLGGVAVDKYGYILGLGDIETQTFYVVYNVDEDRIAFPVYVSVPAYAYIVMDTYEEDESPKGEATKALIVNMINYANQVFDLDPDFDKNSDGAKIYNAIIAQYGEEYLSYYKGLTDERFKEGGDLYDRHGVAALNVDATEGDKEARSYVESISFNFDTYEPTFLIKFSQAAKEKGITKPDATGVITYGKEGLFIYSGYVGDSTLSTKIWVEKDGEKYYGDADFWGDTGYDYYASTSNGAWNATGEKANLQEIFKVQNVRKDLRIQLYLGDGKTATIVGEVKYNLAAYINSMIVSGADYSNYIEAAKALYAYSYVSEAYKTTK